MSKQHLLRQLSLDDESLKLQARERKLQAAKDAAAAQEARCYHMDEQALRDWIRGLPSHPRVHHADQMERMDMIVITHWVRTIHPHEAGLFAFLDPNDMKTYAVPYVAR